MVLIPFVTCLTYLFNIASASIMCSVCDSTSHPQCQTSPSTSQICWSPGSGVTESCSIVRIFKKDTKILLEFRRDCSTASKNICYNPPERNVTICTEICFTSDCNSVVASAARTTSIYVPFCIVVFLTMQTIFKIVQV